MSDYDTQGWYERDPDDSETAVPVDAPGATDDDTPVTRDDVDDLVQRDQPIARQGGEYTTEHLSQDFGWPDHWPDLTDREYDQVTAAATAVVLPDL